ncbi:MAG: hypothetical protein USCGTAYLOR_03041 [Chromatiales bacterium USCg_Taylor]|nr:MAG: hypothetical protein USCGTAYLOR_03041 [Chromatiales bacterium USCg_Taylor]
MSRLLAPDLLMRGLRGEIRRADAQVLRQRFRSPLLDIGGIGKDQRNVFG